MAEDEETTKTAFQYVFTLLAVPLIAIPLAILLGTSDYFMHHGASVWAQANDAVFSLKGQTCKVLVFGDSTAMTGIDPDLVEKQTGLQTCNISVTNAVLAVTGRLTLDHYLAQNSPPDVMVVQLSPEGFQANNAWRNTIYPEGMLELLRHASWSRSADALLHHPQEAIAFAGYTVGHSAWYAIKASSI